MGIDAPLLLPVAQLAVVVAVVAGLTAAAGLILRQRPHRVSDASGAPIPTRPAKPGIFFTERVPFHST